MTRQSDSDVGTLQIIFGLYGAGGFGREVMPFVVQESSKLLKSEARSDLSICFVETQNLKDEVNGVPVCSEEYFLGLKHLDKMFNIAISDSRAREEIACKMIDRGAKPLTLRAPDSTIYSGNSIGQGAIICSKSTITSNVSIGKFFHLNIYSYVAHDCVIGDYVTFAPHVQCNGNVHIGSHAYLGTGAILRQGTSLKPLIIGEGAVVGMGAVVTKDVPPYSTVLGNPARPFVRG